jgi:hypothetical protein
MSYSTIGLPLVHAMPIFYMAFFFLAAMVPVAVGGNMPELSLIMAKLFEI